jgi:acetyl esterase
VNERTLDPGAAEILRQVRDAGVPEWHTLGVERARQVYRERAALLATTPTPVASISDVWIETSAGGMRAKVIHPGGEGPLPVLLYIHGGGWVLGDIDTFEEVCRRLAVAAQCVVVAPEYRLSPESPYPAALDDVHATIAWIEQSAGAFDGDPDRLAVGGDSAGGNIAAGICLQLRDHGGRPLAAQLLIYPALRARFDTASYERNAKGYLLSRDDCRWFWANYLGSASAEDPYACPGEAASLASLPPAILVTAGFDPLCDEGIAYGERLREAGVEVTSLHFDGQIHGFVGLPVELPAGRDAVRRSGEALRRAFAAGAR